MSGSVFRHADNGGPMMDLMSIIAPKGAIKLHLVQMVQLLLTDLIGAIIVLKFKDLMMHKNVEAKFKESRILELKSSIPQKRS